MTREEFVSELAFIFNVAEGALTSETELHSLRAWDSMGVLSVLTLMKQIGAPAKVDPLREAKTIGDLMGLTGDKLS